MNRENLNHLAAFVAVAEAQSFTGAARVLGMSQSSLSQIIGALEERIGVRLLARTTRRVTPTLAGERLLEVTAPRLSAIREELDSLAATRDQPAGTIRITAPEHAAESILWPAATRLMRDYPDINVEIDVSSIFRDIVADRFDAGIRLGESIARDMIALRIGPEMRMAAVASPAYLTEHGVPQHPEELAAHRCINVRFATQGDIYAWEFDKGGRALSVRVEGSLILNSSKLILDAAGRGMGIAFTLEDYVEDLVAGGRLVRILADWCEPFPGYHLYYTSRRQPSAAFRLLIDALRYRG